MKQIEFRCDYGTESFGLWVSNEQSFIFSPRIIFFEHFLSLMPTRLEVRRIIIPLYAMLQLAFVEGS